MRKAGHKISRVVVNADGSFELFMEAPAPPVPLKTPAPPAGLTLAELWTRDNEHRAV